MRVADVEGFKTFRITSILTIIRMQIKCVTILIDYNANLSCLFVEGAPICNIVEGAKVVQPTLMTIFTLRIHPFHNWDIWNLMKLYFWLASTEYFEGEVDSIYHSLIFIV